MRLPLLALVSLILLPLSAAPVLAAGDSTLPLPEIAIPKADKPPVMDGKISPGEWDHAAAVTGFVTAFGNQLARAQTIAWITYDDQFIYIALKNNRAASVTFLSKQARRPDDDNIVFDPSNEVWVTPPGTPATTYQTLFNSYPGVLDTKIIPSVGYTAKSWSGHWQFASSETREDWIVEARAPIQSFGQGNIADGATWKGLFTADIFADPDKFRAWAPGGAFADLTRHGYWRFYADTPTFQLLNVENIFTGHFSFPMAVTGPSHGESRVNVTLRFGSAVNAQPGDLVLTRELNAANGRREDFTLSGDLTTLNLPLKQVDLPGNPGGTKKVPSGFCEITSKSDDGRVLYHQVFPFFIDGQVRTSPAAVQATPYKNPFGLQAFYAPLNKKLIVKVDRLYLGQRAEAVSGTARLLDPETGKVVAQQSIAPFHYDYSEFPMDLHDLKVPVQTEADWTRAKPVLDENEKIQKENEKRAAQNQPPLPLRPVPGPQPAPCSLEVVLTSAGGQEIATTRIPVDLLNYEFQWLPNTVGISDKVIPPWTPLRWKQGVLSLWNKAYSLNGLGLAEKIRNAGAPQLSGPMKLVAVVNGQDREVKASAPTLRRLTEANADFSGETKLDNLRITTSTHTEFDGFVLNTMQLTPQGATRLDRLSLVVTMPATEAPCLVTTAGGWSAYHGWTPPKWDSRETSSGSLHGNFVPYIFLTDSDRGFCWFADNEKGWLLDPAAPTQEVWRQGDTITLRVNFINRPGILQQPTTIRYGWMVTPGKPQPANFRAYVVSGGKPHPMSVPFFWADADWAVLWPYYSSPYPWDYQKSAQAIAASESRGVRAMVGNIAHAIARYRDYQGRWFTPVAADWGLKLGDTSNGDVARGPGPNDFQLWHWDQWVKKSGLAGLYFDENYLAEDYNYLTGGAYLLPDGDIQPGYDYLGLREMDKRLRYMFHDNGKEPPNLWLHTTSGQAVYSWMPDIMMEGENVEPTGGQNDYLEALPASRLRSIGMGRNLGAVPIIMCQADRHWDPAHSPFLVPQFVGWVLAHDCLPEQAPFWPTLMGEMEMWQPEIRFLPYWKPGQGITSSDPEIEVSAHVRPGHAVLWIVNTARQDRRAVLHLNLKQLELDANRPLLIFDAETGERYTIQGGQLGVDIPARFWRALRLMQPAHLSGRETFTASFDQVVAADEALGDRFPRTQNVLPATSEGKTGKGAALDQELTFEARHHVTRERGEITFQLHFDPTMDTGTLLQIQGLRVLLAKNRIRVIEGSRAAGEGEILLPPGKDWHKVSIGWQDQSLRVTVDEKEALTAQLQAPVPIPPMARGLEIRGSQSGSPQPAGLTFGPIQGAVIDNLVMED